MSRITNILLSDLRSLIPELGKNGGLVSPSVYDTAQILRLYPPQEGVWSGLDWLLAQQQVDGGWGNSAASLTRDVTTLASVLALCIYGGRKSTREAAQFGLAFLRRQVSQWRQPLPDYIPIGVELLLPQLLNDAAKLGLGLSREPYAALLELGKQRRSLIAQMQHVAGTPPVHSWEAWGINSDPMLLDGSGGVGASPAATASWLHAAKGNTALMSACALAQRYLLQASESTRLGIPGCVPTVWPITRFEQAYGLYSLLIVGLLDHSALQDVVKPQIHNLALALQPTGLGHNEFFVTDGDDTAIALAVLRSTNHQVDPAILEQFENDDHFCTYKSELHPSLITTAHAVFTLKLFGKKVTRPQIFLVERQCPDGRWSADKWHSSWLYTTMEAVLALANSVHTLALKSAVEAMLAHQNIDGGWGMGNKSTSIETAYGIITLRTLRAHGLLEQDRLDNLQKAYQWLLRNYRPFNISEDKHWTGKELYRPHRVDRAFELSTLLAVALEENYQ